MAIFGQHNAEKIKYQREWFDWSKAENLPSMQEALDEGQDINEIVMDGLSAASISAREGKLRLFEFLREKGADFNAFDGNKMNALMCSAHAGTIKIAAKLLARGDPAKTVAAVNENGQTALHFAAGNGRAEMIQFLLTKGTDVHAKDADGNTPLHMAMKGGAPLAVKVLMGAGADESAENAKGQTPAKMSGGHAACRQALSGESVGGMGGFAGAGGMGASMAAAHASMAGMGSAHGFGGSGSGGGASLGSSAEEAVEARLELLKGGAISTLFPTTQASAHAVDIQKACEAIDADDEAELDGALGRLILAGVDPILAKTAASDNLLRLAIEQRSEECSVHLGALIAKLEEGDVDYAFHALKNNSGDSPYDACFHHDDAESFDMLLGLENGLNASLTAELFARIDKAGADRCRLTLASDYGFAAPAAAAPKP